MQIDAHMETHARCVEAPCTAFAFVSTRSKNILYVSMFVACIDAKQQNICQTCPGGGLKHFLFSPLPGEMIQFDYYFANGLQPPTCFKKTRKANLIVERSEKLSSPKKYPPDLAGEIISVRNTK